MENKIPIVLCRKLPLISLGELQKAPKARARAISEKSYFNPIITGSVRDMPTKIAFEKLVLLKNTANFNLVYAATIVSQKLNSYISLWCDGFS